MSLLLNKGDECLKEFLVEEPLEEMSQRIENDPSSQILLGGGRLTGKTSILHYLENKTRWTDHQFIYMNFDSSGWGQLSRDDELNQKLYACRYEVQVCKRLLSFIEGYYSYAFSELYGDLSFSVEELSSHFYNYLRKIYDTNSIDKSFSYSQLSPKIINRIREDISPVSLSLIIDRFDWINNRRVFAQEILSKYFSMFDKVVVTTDDRNILDSDRQDKLFRNGYSYIESTYGKDMEVVKEMIGRRVGYCNQQLSPGESAFPIECIDDEVYNLLVEKADGNLFLILKSFSETMDDWQFDKRFSIEDSCEKNMDREIQKRKVLDKSFLPTQFYV